MPYPIAARIFVSNRAAAPFMAIKANPQTDLDRWLRDHLIDTEAWGRLSVSQTTGVDLKGSLPLGRMAR